ncbi:MAG: UDP-3-O-[3-hydroxymyristoyl] glucosamine N-acyltransferase [Gemmatimonadetes bacterium]|nr:UDP-3-O-[3-hydroxymyristoyl] glucosamine N-acyltransferase [Gemmatimonadota bacterium]
MTFGPLSAQAIAELAGGRVSGDAAVEITGVAPLDRAGPGDLAFLAVARYLDEFRASRAGVVLVPEDLADVAGGPTTRIVVRDPARALGDLLRRLVPDARPPAGVDPAARIGPGVVLGLGVSIGPFAVLGREVRLGDRVVVSPGVVIEDGVTVGDDVYLGPRVVCGRGTRLGNRVRVKAGAVLGSTGFGFSSDREGHHRIPHVGGCVIEDDVDIGANTTIDRGSIGDTVVGAGTKIDNLVQLGHNVRIGRHCLLMSQVGVAGSSRLGDRVILAGQVGIAGHLTIGDGARLAAQSGLSNDVPAGADFGGYPARANREWLRSLAVLYRLTPIAKDLERLVRERSAHA